MIPDWTHERQQMVEEQLRRRGIRDPRVLAAMAAVPREAFVPDEQRIASYSDQPLPIGYGQTISQPYMVALMAEALRLQPTDRVLEIGAGCGYHAAVLAMLAGHVYTVEVVPALAVLARQNLERAGFAGRVTVLVGDGSNGWPEFSPYDAISVAAGAPEVPEALAAQLADGGRMVIPVGEMDYQELRLVTKHGPELECRTIAACRFVLLRGQAGWR
jgi:protein-L-isoaspartate(D-aspartate) O-methyltransferase